MHFEPEELVWIIVGIVSIYSGISRYSTMNNPYQWRYTKESLKKFSKIYRDGLCIIGVLMFVEALFIALGLPRIFTGLDVAAMAIVGIYVFIAFKKVLVRD